MFRSTFRNIIGGTDYPTHMAPRVVTKLSVRLCISQTARSVRPMEEQPRGLDTIADLSLYGGRVRVVFPHLIGCLEEFEDRSYDGLVLVWVFPSLVEELLDMYVFWVILLQRLQPPVLLQG